MKRSILLFTAISGMAFFTLSSYQDGPAKNHSKGDLTGTGGTCSGSNCHGAMVTDATTTLYLKDQLGNTILPGSNYIPTKSYSLVLNTYHLNASKFGLQISSTNPAHVLNIGTLVPVASNIVSVSSSVTGTVPLLEHSSPITATAGSVSLTNGWIAPNSGKGDVTFNAIILATNGNGSADAGDVYYNISVTYHEPTAVNDLPSSIGITAYPNPAQNNFNLKFENAVNGTYQVSIFNLNGQQLQTQNIAINNSAEMTIATDNLAAGMYLVHVQKDGAQRVLPISIR